MASLENYQGTISPAANFSAEADCQALSQAMRGAGTNERALIDVSANRSNSQRQQIKAHYKASFGHVRLNRLHLIPFFSRSIPGFNQTPVRRTQRTFQRNYQCPVRCSRLLRRLVASSSTQCLYSLMQRYEFTTFLSRQTKKEHYERFFSLERIVKFGPLSMHTDKVDNPLSVLLYVDEPFSSIFTSVQKRARERSEESCWRH